MDNYWDYITYMNDTYFYLDTKKNNLYQLDEDGFLLLYDKTLHIWSNVSTKVDFSLDWKPLKTEEAVTFSLNYYKTISENIENENAINEKRKPFTFGKDMKYYKFGKMVCAVDESGNNYQCTKERMIPLYKDMVDRIWRPLNPETLFDEIDGKASFYNLYDMELYISDEGVVHGFSNDSTHFYLSPFTKELNICLDSEILDDWKGISEVALEEIEGEDWRVSILKKDKDALINLYEYLKTVTERYNEKHKDKCGNEYKYYSSPYGEVFAIDEKGNEYTLRKSVMKHLKKGSMELLSLTPLSNVDVIKCITYYQGKKKKKNSTNPYELVLYKEKSGEYLGINERGEVYILNESGEFEERDKESFKETKAKKVERREVVVKQALLRYKKKLEPYLETCKRRLKIRGVTLGKEVTFYTNPTSIHMNVFSKDEKGNEFQCNKFNMIPVEKGSIKEDKFIKIYGYNLDRLLDIVVIT